ncbi:hypothetical protein [Piscirickettsia litoralis]|uniref:Polysaccharide biosynthesis protein n=1 Tax=Piscirickettsia litoralis TaxID=1891921 RepID=A0ABX3A2P1_9GAMM|nr:hypothetical protein [Piscirickettsia litoralis]ODN43137.1 hypothetical protein BGC07_09710 [Piscirickettsia litoralis]
MSHHLGKISSGVSKIASAIFFVNVFAYGRVFFATILATRISHEAVVALSFSMSVMTVANMIIFGILSIIGMDIAKAKDAGSYQSYIAKYFKISGLICVIVLLLAMLFALLTYGHVSLLATEFILVYAVGFIPFIFSSALRYILLARTYSKIIKITNIITFIICVVVTLLCYYLFENTSIVSFAFGCIIGFLYNLLHLVHFSLKKEVISFSFLRDVKSTRWMECLRFIFEGCKVSLVYASDSIVCAIIIMLTLSYGESYVVAVQVALQLFLFASFWITGFANGVMIELPKYGSIRQSKKALKVVLSYIFKKAVIYWLSIAVILFLFSGVILKYIFNLHGLSYEIAHIEIHMVIVLVLFDFIRQSLFYILRLLNQVVSAVFFSYLIFAFSIILMLSLKYFEKAPAAFLALYVISCIVISILYLKKIINFRYARR